MIHTMFQTVAVFRTCSLGTFRLFFNNLALILVKRRNVMILDSNNPFLEAGPPKEQN